MGTVVMYSSVSVDGFVADENDQPGPLFDWLSSGDVPLDESGAVKVSQTSSDQPNGTECQPESDASHGQRYQMFRIASRRSGVNRCGVGAIRRPLLT